MGRSPHRRRIPFTMSTWTVDELDRIGSADELRIAGRREDGTQVRGQGRIESGGVSKDVVFTRDDSRDAEIDAAYRAKYGTGSPVRAITSATATSTTLRVDPA